MGFTSQIFLFVFFPILVAAYYSVYFLSKRSAFLQKLRAVELLLIAVSLVFYAWAYVGGLGFLCLYIAAVYAMGRITQYMMKRGGARYVKLTAACFWAITVGLLCYFKGWERVWQAWLDLTNSGDTARPILAPLGISFITFSAISYLVDIYKGRAEAGSLIDCALYLSFFAKVVSGPIVLWRDFKGQTPQVSLDNVTDGITRVMIGFAKKTILADTFGYCIAEMAVQVDVPTAWGAAILYMLQIYYDFSGYSDIAIGLSQMLGLHIKENFNFPYLSTSITEFWRRWHISLGTWFREYVYIPLGGSRKGTVRTLVNIGIVFVLTGIWHGTGLTYLAWGIVNGICNMAEKLLDGNKLYERTPKGIKWLGTMGVTLFCWQLFRASSGRAALYALASMVGLTGSEGLVYTWSYYFDAQIVTFAIIGFLGATVFGLPKVQQAYEKLQQTKVGYGIRQAVAVVLFVLAVLFMVNSTYSPFLYFQY